MHKTILILGITGGLGHACAHAFAARGWRLKALHRAPERAATGVPDLKVDWHRGDALDRRAVRDAARGADLILHGVNPPGYRRWAELAPAMLENSLAAARAAGVVDVQIDVQRDIRHAEVESRKVFIEALLTVEATGRPRVASA